MEKPEKVQEDVNSDVYECLRCKEEYCNSCNDSVEIDFDIDAKEEDSIVSKGDYVCPFCYNQLLIKNN